MKCRYYIHLPHSLAANRSQTFAVQANFQRKSFHCTTIFSFPLEYFHHRDIGTATHFSQIPEWGISKRSGHWSGNSFQSKTSLDVLGTSAAAFVKVPQHTCKIQQNLMLTSSRFDTNKILNLNPTAASCVAQQPSAELSHRLACVLVNKHACTWAFAHVWVSLHAPVSADRNPPAIRTCQLTISEFEPWNSDGKHFFEPTFTQTYDSALHRLNEKIATRSRNNEKRSWNYEMFSSNFEISIS